MYRVDANAGFPPALHEYDVLTNTWAIRATLPARNYTQLATDTVSVYALPYNGNIYRYDPIGNAWVFVQAGPAAANGAGPIAMFETHAGEFYWGNDGTSTLHFTVGGVWNSVATPLPISSGSGIDRGNGVLYIREFAGLGFFTYDIASNSFPTICDSPMSVGENSRVGVFFDGLFYSREWNMPLRSIDPADCSEIDTGTTLSTYHASTDVSPSGVIYLNGYSATETTFEAFDISTNSVTPLASAPAYGGNSHPSLVVLAPCGNGSVDSGEQCDDGNSAPGDCCDPTCQFEANGSACPADSDVCTDDVCDGAGACGVYNTAPCDDLDACTTSDACNGAGTCTGGSPPNCNDNNACSQDSCNSGSGCINDFTPVGSCKAAGKSILLLKNNASDDGKDKLIWKWLKGASTTLGELGSPTATTDYTLCLYAGTASAAVAIPAGSNWQAAATKGFKYKQPSGAPAGAQKAVLKSGSAGKAKLLVKGKGTALPDTLVPALALPVTVQLVNDESSVCYEASYVLADVIKNDVNQFKAKQ